MTGFPTLPRTRGLRALGVALALSTLVWAPRASADRGRLHLNGDVGLGAPLSGRYGTALEERYSAQSLGPHLTLGLDYQVLPPLALELIGEVGVQLIPSWLAVRNLL